MSGSRLPHGESGALARDLLARLPEDDPILEADRRQAARVLAERARVASESFRRQGADWDEMRALDLPAQAVEAALLSLVPDAGGARLLDIGTGTGRVLELLAPRVSQGVGVDASKAMLALARSRLARPGLAHCSVRLADMYRLPLAEASFDVAVLQMVLHYAEDPPGVLGEVARVLRPGGRLIVIDLAQHGRDELLTRLAHRWPGFSDAAMRALLDGCRFATERTPRHRGAARGAHLARHAHCGCPGRAIARTCRLKEARCPVPTCSMRCVTPCCCATAAWAAACRRMTLDVERDFHGKENCTDVLNLSRPDLVRDIHRGYFEAGADMVETNTFGGSPVTLAEFDIADQAFEINRRGGELAREAAEQFSDGRHRWVIGSVGPGTKLPSSATSPTIRWRPR